MKVSAAVWHPLNTYTALWLSISVAAHDSPTFGRNILTVLALNSKAFACLPEKLRANRNLAHDAVAGILVKVIREAIYAS